MLECFTLYLLYLANDIYWFWNAFLYHWRQINIKMPNVKLYGVASVLCVLNSPPTAYQWYSFCMTSSRELRWRAEWSVREVVWKVNNRMAKQVHFSLEFRLRWDENKNTNTLCRIQHFFYACSPLTYVFA